MNIEQEIRAQIEKNKGLKLAVGEINYHLSTLDGLLRNERDDAQKRVDEAYQRGLDDAWEAAKKIFGYEIDGGIPIDKIGSVFGYSENATFCTADIIRHNTASEAIEKLKAYEEKQKADDEIKVGDEVYCKGDDESDSGVVTWVGKERVCAMWQDGSAGEVQKDEVIKTGRHFDIEKILEEMRG